MIRIALQAAPLALALCCACRGDSPPVRDAADDAAGDLAPGTEGVDDSGPPDLLELATRLVIDDGKAVRFGRRAIAFDPSSSSYVVVWDRIDLEGDDYLVLARVAEDGSIALPPREVVSITEEAPALALQLVVVEGAFYIWIRGSSLKGRALRVREKSGQLAVETEESFDVCDGSDNRTVGVDWDGQSFGLLVERRAANGRRQVYFSRLDNDLQTIAGSELQLSPTETHQRWPVLRWVGQHYHALWVDDSEDTLHAALVSSESVLLKEPQEVASVQDSRPRAALDGAGGSLVIWADGERACRVLRLGSDLSPFWGQPRSLVPANRFAAPAAAIASFEKRAIVAWASDLADPLPQILAATIALPPVDANVLLKGGERLSSRDLFREPAAAVGPSSFGVVFTGTMEGEERLFFRALRK